MPEVKLVIVGDQSHYLDKIIVKDDKNVVLTGKVDSISPYLKHAGLMIAPFRMGSGIRIKILTAMAAGVPVVSTPIGAEGIKYRREEEILIAETPEGFTEKVLKLLKNKEISEKLSKNSTKLIEKTYNYRKAEKVISKVGF
jgi:glycosyltransferase involved in cell wall biosynthesis